MHKLILRFFLLIFTITLTATTSATMVSIQGGDLSWNKVDDKSAILEFQLDDEWHVFWKHPGTVGIPFSITAIIADKKYPLQMQWPTPSRFKLGNLELWGYGGDVRFPINLPENLKFDDVDRFVIKGQACKEVCVPVDVEIAKQDYITNKAYTPQQFAQLMLDIPKENDAFELQSRYMLDASNEDIAFLTVDVHFAQGVFNQPKIHEATRKDLAYRTIERTISDDKKSVRFELELSGMKFSEFPLEQQPLEFLLTEGDYGVVLHGTAKKIITPAVPKGKAEIAPVSVDKTQTIIEQASPFVGAFDIALIVQAIFIGLIFNVMPCVFPVLGIKLGSVLNVIGEQRREIRLRFTLTALGIIIAFALLAAILLALKALGANIGWGIQFQQPIFVTILIVILTIFAASIFGFWHLRQPSIAGSVAKPNLLGEIGSGMLATVLATPCTVPLMAPVAAFAFAGSNMALVSTFIFIGIGMALPWLLVALFPAVVNLLPKPGNWMQYFKIFLGLLLISTNLWLLWILQHQTDSAVTMAVALTSLLIMMVLAFGGSIQSDLKWAMVLGLSLLALNLALIASNSMPQQRLEPNTIIKKGEIEGLPYSKERLDTYLSEGAFVLVIGTAEWCITCKVNEQRVFSDIKVRNLIEQNQIKVLIVDLTTSNPEGEAWQQSLNRHGLPLTVFYRSEKEAIILPTILSVQDMLRLKPE